MRVLLLLALLAPVAGLRWLLEPAEPAQAPPVTRTEGGERSPATLAPGAVERPGSVATHGLGVSVGGRVVDVDGHPVAGARVRSLDDRGQVRDVTSTDTAGAFRLDDAFWDGPLRVDGGLRGCAVVFFDDEDRRDLRIGLHPVGVLRGRVLGPDGATPVPNARVVAEDWHTGTVSTRAEGDGSFAIAPVRADVSFDVFADAGARGRSRLLDVRCGTGTLELRLEPVRLVEGIVVTPGPDDALHAVAGVAVSASERGKDVPDGEAVVSDASGRFALPVLGFWARLTVRSPDWYQAEPPPSLPRGGPATILVRPRVDLRGRCVRDDGTPVSGAEVSCDVAYEERSVFTDDDGRFRVPKVGVRSFKETTLEARRGPLRGVRVCSKQPVVGDDVVLVLRPTPFVGGRVLDDEGTPVVGAWACISHGPDASFACEPTDRDGCFVVAGLEAGPCEVVIEAGGFATRRLETRATAVGTRLGALRLERLPVREGWVLDEAGRPIRGASFEVEHVGDRPIPVAPDGSFRVALPAWPMAILRFRAPGRREHAIPAHEVPAADPWIVTLLPGPTLGGRVVDDLGRPVTTGQVVLRTPSRGATWRARIDTSGRFGFELDAWGPFELDLEAPGHELPDPVTVTAGQRALHVRAAVKPMLAGRVLGPDGRGIGGVAVAARDADVWRSEPRRTWTREDGTFRSTGLTGRWFHVDVERLPEGLVAAPLRWVDAGTHDLVLRVEEAESIEGRLLGVVDGTPETFEVSIRTVEGERCRRSMALDADGSFRIRGLRPGVYVLTGRVGPPRRPDAIAGPVRVRAGATNVLLVPGPPPATEDHGD